MKKKHVLIKVFLGIALGAAAGLAAGKEAEIFGVPWIRIFSLMGQLFLNALTIVVVPLVSSSIIIGTARAGADQEFKKMGSRTFFYFIFTSLLAVLTGLALTLAVGPGSAIDFRALQQTVGSSELTGLGAAAAGEGALFDKFEHLLLSLIPSNILSVAAQGQLLGLILFSLLVGYFIPRIPPALSETMHHFWDGVFQIMMRMTHLVMEFLPLGVFGLVAKVTATTGLATIKPVSIFFITVVAGLGVHMFFTLSLLLKFVGKVDVANHIRSVFPAVITGFTTSSTAATLPITIECMEKRAGLPNTLCSFILPLGTTLNLAGTALYATSAVVFISQAYHLEMHLTILIPIIILGLFTSLGMVAGIPSGSIVAIVVILQSIGLPAEGIVLILAVERILDMCRTSASVYNNASCAVLVHKW